MGVLFLSQDAEAFAATAGVTCISRQSQAFMGTLRQLLPTLTLQNLSDQKGQSLQGTPSFC